MYPLSITRNIKEIILCALCFLIPFSICFSIDWANNRIHESNGDWAQKAYYDILTISDAAKQFHQKYGEYHNAWRTERCSGKIQKYKILQGIGF